MKTKILLTTVILFFAAFSANAQIDKGKYLFGGSINVSGLKSNQTSSNLKNESLYTSIQFGKVLKENTVVGIIASYSYNNYYVNSPQETKSNSYSAGIFYRKYKSLVKDLYFFGEVNTSYFHSWSEQGLNLPANYGERTISNGVSANFIPGISYTVCKRMQIELLMQNIIGISYSHSKTNYPTAPPSTNLNHDENSFSFNANLNSNLLSNFGIGFKFLLGK